jgi:hypothetical protein
VVITPLRAGAVAIVGLAAVVCAACGGAPASDAAPSIERMEADLVRRVNAARRERALTALKTDRALASAARVYSCRMAAERFLGHEAPDGSTLADRIRATGKPYRLLGENLAMNVNAADPVAAAVTGWMKRSRIARTSCAPSSPRQASGSAAATPATTSPSSFSDRNDMGRDQEERHGSAGALRTYGDMGAMSGPP